MRKKGGRKLENGLINSISFCIIIIPIYCYIQSKFSRKSTACMTFQYVILFMTKIVW